MLHILLYALSLILLHLKFQGFNWESWRRQWYLELAPKAADLSQCGVTAVWLPPPTESVAPQGLSAIFLFQQSMFFLSCYGCENKDTYKVVII